MYKRQPLVCGAFTDQNHKRFFAFFLLWNHFLHHFRVVVFLCPERTFIFLQIMYVLHLQYLSLTYFVIVFFWRSLLKELDCVLSFIIATSPYWWYTLLWLFFSQYYIHNVFMCAASSFCFMTVSFVCPSITDLWNHTCLLYTSRCV